MLFQRRDRIPDAKTVWLFRERLQALGLVDVLFARFDEQLAQRGYVAKESFWQSGVFNGEAVAKAYS
jgi:hypothetical protein